MTRLVWNSAGTRRYQAGVDNGVLYPATGPGVAWNGLVSVQEQASGGEVTELKYEGVKYLDQVSGADFKATLEAFTYPNEFDPYEGSYKLAPGLFATLQPRRATFGLCYRTGVGNDVDGIEHGYRLHLVYNATAQTSPKSFKSRSEDPDLETFTWDLTATPPAATTYKPTAHFVIDSTQVASGTLALLENQLYGTGSANPFLPTQSSVIALLNTV